MGSQIVNEQWSNIIWTLAATIQAIHFIVEHYIVVLM